MNITLYLPHIGESLFSRNSMFNRMGGHNHRNDVFVKQSNERYHSSCASQGSKRFFEVPVQRPLVYFIQRNREDHVPINLAIISRLAQDNRVIVLLGEGVRNGEYERLRSCLKVVSITDEHTPWSMHTLCLLPPFFIALLLKYLTRQPPSSRRPRQLWQFFRNCLPAYRFLKADAPRCVVGIKFETIPAFAAAAQILGIDLIGIQHGDYYRQGYLDGHPHEYPARKIMLWNREALDFCKNRFRSGYEFDVVGPLWTVRFKGSQNIPKNRHIVIYESGEDTNFQKLVMEMLERFGPELVKVKAHPYLIRHGCSVALPKFPELLYETALTSEVPMLGIAFMSTVGHEVIFLGSPCLFVGDLRKKHPVSLPEDGVYDSSDVVRIGDIISDLLSDETRYTAFVEAQRAQLGYLNRNGFDVPGKIAKSPLLTSKSLS